MPFIGTTPTQGFVSAVNKQSFTPNGSTTAFTLSHQVADANDLEVFVGNVRQEPTAAYTAAGTTLTMSEAPATGLNFYVIFKNKAQVTTTPPVNSISTDKIVNDAVTGAKIENNPTIAGNLATGGTLTSTGLITASAGVAIGGTGSANTLDDYEEGTFTPSLGGNTTYHAQVGKYTKVGNVVHCGVVIQANSLGSGSTTTVSGFPFTSSNAGNGYQGGDIGFYYFLASNVMSLDVQMTNGATTCGFSGRSSAGNTISSTIAVFANGARIDFSVTYYVA